MKKMNDTAKSLLVDALLEAEGAELESFGCTAAPSNAFSQRIRRLAEHPEKYTKKHRIKKIVIILIAAAIILTGCTAIKPVRMKIASFIVTVFDKGSSIGQSTDKKAKTIITEFYTPAFIPDGYIFVDEKITRYDDGTIFSRTLIYEKGEKKLMFDQIPAHGGMTINTENAEITKIKINGIECLYARKTDHIYVAWENEGYKFLLTLHEDISENTIIKIIESVKLG